VRPALSILNENLRGIFGNFFAKESPDKSDLEVKGTCSELAFDIPMRKILPDKASPEEKDSSKTHQSEQELEKMKKYFEDLPRSPPVTILSDEKWYAYSQYEFHHDGSPYADSAERVSTQSVPEVLGINLPIGFEASKLTPTPAEPKSPPPAPDRATATVVDFPSTPENKRSYVNVETVAKRRTSESDEIDLSQLSATGKRFMEQLPDLSYMLKSTLSLPKDNQ